ncbi:hypothetical protein ACQ4PT_034084 [Festuca glaucescens]
MALLTDLLNLDLSGSTEKIIAEYIWIGGSGMDLRSKARTLPGPVTDPSKLPKWNYDGSSTGQAPGEDSEVILYPQAIFKDPFRRGNNILVMCDCYTPAGEPIPTNKRNAAAKVFSNPAVAAEEPWYGIEQEYTLLQKDINWPLGWPVGGFPGPQGPYYCSIGAEKSFGRDIVDSHYKACLFAGINISGINGEVMPDQWEFQVGPSVGISAGDQVWVARYILERITEIAGVVVTFDPKPIPGDWNGAGAHTNYSTESMRKDGGVRGHCRRSREAQAEAQGAHRCLRRGQRAPSHWQARDRRHPHLQLGCCQPWRVDPCRPRDGAERQGLL